MKTRIKLQDISYEIEDATLTNLKESISKWEKNYSEYDELYIEKQTVYGYNQGEEYDELYLYGSREETKEELDDKNEKRIMKDNDAKQRRKEEWENLSKEFGE